MIRVFVFDTTRRRWTEIPNGPFPVTREQIAEAQRLYQDEWSRTPELTGVRVSPQTTARDLLKHVAPHLNDFDRAMLGFAVSNTRTRVEDAIDDL